MLSKCNMQVKGCESEDIFRDIPNFQFIQNSILRIQAIFDIELSHYLLLEERALQPIFKKWRNAQLIAKEKIGMVREEIIKDKLEERLKVAKKLAVRLH